MNRSPGTGSRWGRRFLFGFGFLALAATAFGAFLDRRQFFFSYLFGCLCWLGVSLGCLGWVMIHQLTGGRWGYPTRRFFEAGALAIPLMLILFVPLFFGLDQIYPWARPAERQHELVLQKRHAYENVWPYVFRTTFILGSFALVAILLRRWSLQQDVTPDAAPTRKARALSGPGLVLYGFMGSFGAIDWVMSLETRWYSTMFPIIVIIGQILAALALSVATLPANQGTGPAAGAVTRRQYHQLGNLLLTLVLFWTYVSFGQLLIIYSGDLPPELDWYRHRIAGGWKGVVAVLALFHFFVPFGLLLFRAVKWHATVLTSLAGVLFLMHFLDVYWMTMPSLHQAGPAFSWLDAVAPLGIGALWAAVVWGRLVRAPLVPLQDPGLQFSPRYGH